MAKIGLVLAMVMLSTAAWGETPYVKCLDNCKDKNKTIYGLFEENACKENCRKLLDISKEDSDRFAECSQVCEKKCTFEAELNGMCYSACVINRCMDKPKFTAFKHSDIKECRLQCLDSKGIVDHRCESSCLEFLKVVSGVSFTAPDPTAWKQTGSKFGSGIVYPIYIRPETTCDDSRYRLEKNDVTGEYRITERPRFPLSENESWVPVKCTNSPYSKYEPEWIECLNEYRSRERKDKAWRPIK